MCAKLIQFLIYPNVNLIDFAGPLEAFITANHFAQQGAPPYSICAVSLEADTQVISGLQMSTQVLSPMTPAPNTLIIPGGAGIDGLCADPKFTKILIPHMDKSERLVSVCTGVFALAAANKLEGRKVTTHWSAYDELEQKYPNVIVTRGPIFINDGSVWTSAGVTSGIDLALSLIELDLGHAAALQVARHLVMFLKRPGDQNQYSSSLALQSGSRRFSDLHAWIGSNLNADLSVSALAKFMNMSERNFARRYAEKVGSKPSKMVELIRLEAVCQLLINSDSPLKEIAIKTGIGSEATLIRRFMKIYGVTPGEHRNRFKSQY